MNTLKRRTAVFLLIILITSIGCMATGHIGPRATGKLSLGMTKEQVIKALGRPETVTGNAQGEVLTYMVERPWWNWKRMRVTIVDGKVTSFQ